MTDWTEADLTQNKHFNALKQEVADLKAQLDHQKSAIDYINMSLRDAVNGMLQIRGFLFKRFGYGVDTGAVDEW